MNFGETPIRENIVDNHNNLSTLREGRSVYLNLGRLREEIDDRSKSPGYQNLNNLTNYQNQNNMTNLSQNKGVIRNIETNVKKKLNFFKFFINFLKIFLKIK